MQTTSPTPPSPSRFKFKDPRKSQSKTARQVLTALLATAKHILTAPATTARVSRKLSKRNSKRDSTTSASKDKKLPALPPRKKTPSVTENDQGLHDDTLDDPTSHANFRVASASQLNGRHVEHAIRADKKTPFSARTQSLRGDRHILPPPTLVRSRSTPLLTASNLRDREREREDDDNATIKAYSPALSTIAEQTEIEGPIRPLSEVLSIGEARVLPIIRTHDFAQDYETAVTRFAAKATKLINELGPTLEVYGRREMAMQRSEGFDAGPEYFHPLLSKPFTKLAICDVNIPGEPIKLSSKSFEPGSASLQVGECKYLNLTASSNHPVSGHTVVLRTEHDISASPVPGAQPYPQTRYMLHYALPLVDECMHKAYTLVSQVDVTQALRRLALQDCSASLSSAATGSPQKRTAVSSQMRRLLSFVYWLGAFHSNALCFKRTGHGEEDEWQLRLASSNIFADESMVVESGPGTGNAETDMAYMARLMDGDMAFVQSVVWGRYNGGCGSEFVNAEIGYRPVKREGEAKSYLQYCVPVTDGREEGEKWWVGWLVDKEVRGFWGRSMGGIGNEVVEYPFLV